MQMFILYTVYASIIIPIDDRSWNQLNMSCLLISAAVQFLGK